MNPVQEKKLAFHLECVAERYFPPDLDLVIRELLCACFPADQQSFSQTRHWHGSAPEFSIVGRNDGTLAGQVGVVLRTIACGTEETSVAGIQNLAVRPEFRGRGLAQRLIREAMEESRQRNVAHGLLFCSPGLEQFYKSLDWVTLPRVVTMLDENGNSVALPSKTICMTIPLQGKPFPFGNLDLRGADW